jgi:hypothetical protein
MEEIVNRMAQDLGVAPISRLVEVWANADGLASGCGLSLPLGRSGMIRSHGNVISTSFVGKMVTVASRYAPFGIQAGKKVKTDHPAKTRKFRNVTPKLRHELHGILAL